jgi:hypothetical protein
MGVQLMCLENRWRSALMASGASVAVLPPELHVLDMSCRSSAEKNSDKGNSDAKNAVP